MAVTTIDKLDSNESLAGTDLFLNRKADNSDVKTTLAQVKEFVYPPNADAETDGLLTHSAQVIAGNKTFNNDVSAKNVLAQGTLDVDGVATFNEDSEFEKDVEVKGTLTVDGDIIQNGSAYETHAEKVYSKNDLIITRDGAETALGDDEVTGIQAEKYDGENDGQLVFDKDGTARVGDVGDTQPLATRKEDTEMTDGKFVKWNATTKQLETSNESVAEIDDTVTSVAKTSSSKKITDSVSTIVVSGGNVATTTHELTATLQGVTELYNGLTVRLLITSALQSSSAITQVNLNINSLGAIPIKAGRGNALVNLASHQMTAGASYNSSYPYRVCDAYTTLELVYCDGAFIVIGDAVVMSYTSTTEGYTVKANGLIEQFGTSSAGSVTLKIAYSSSSYNLLSAFNNANTDLGKTGHFFNISTNSVIARTYSTMTVSWKTMGY